MGRRIAGYFAPIAILSQEAHNALIAVQDALDTLKGGYHLKIFDTYRPATAVADFLDWAKDHTQQEMKNEYYPHIDKKRLFELGYLAERSSHSRGSTVDLTICVLDNPSLDLSFHKELEMETRFDFFDEISHTMNPNISARAKENRAFLVDIMEKQGFINYPKEWWHFTLKDEPFPETYFDFPIGELS